MSNNIGVTIICPLIGTILCNIMWVIPIRAIVIMRRDESIGALNPIPWCITIYNCIGWSTYGLLKRDIFIFLSNCFGLLLGLFYCISGISVMTIDKNTTRNLKKEKNIVEGLVIGAFSMWLFVGMIIRFASSADAIGFEKGVFAVGIIGDFCGLAYYAAPLSTMKDVIRLKDSSSLHIPTLTANLANALMWIIYGMVAIRDPLVWVPNLLGGILTCSQLTLCLLYPRNKKNNNNLDTQADMISNDNNVTHNPLMHVIVDNQEIFVPILRASDDAHKVFNEKIIKETELDDELL